MNRAVSDVELAVANIANARQYADAALPFLGESAVTSPSLLVLRDVGFCFESEGALQHRLAIDPVYPPAEQLAAEAESRTWSRKSADVWTTWNTRNAATPES